MSIEEQEMHPTERMWDGDRRLPGKSREMINIESVLTEKVLGSLTSMDSPNNIRANRHPES